jgi:phytoene dehydrogenase-like protein
VRYDAIVIGSGPNGLTAAARLATSGWSVLVVEAAPVIGGGCRTAPLTGDAVYDTCSSVHPLAASSPAFEALGLAERGVRWAVPPVALAHPFDDATAAVLSRDITVTADSLGADAGRWERMIGGIARRWHDLRHAVLAPVPRGVVTAPFAMARFGALAALPAAAVTRMYSERAARALFTGIAAHSGVPHGRPATAAIGLVLGAAGQATGMPFAAGGSGEITAALAAVVTKAGGTIEPDRVVRDLGELPPARAVLADVTPTALAAMGGPPARRWHYGFAAWKLDLLLSGPLPWAAAACSGAGTVHLGGEADEVRRSVSATARGELVAMPYVLVAQPSVADPGRCPPGQHVVWAYRHVPNGCADPSATIGIEAQFDRFAPGWRDLVLHRKVTTPADLQRANAGYVGGDIAGGAMTPWQTVARPRLAFDPYRTRRDGVWLCSQSTPPGPGVHGMCGWHAAGSVLAHG